MLIRDCSVFNIHYQIKASPTPRYGSAAVLVYWNNDIFNTNYVLLTDGIEHFNSYLLNV